MIRTPFALIIICLSFLFMSACANDEASKKEGDYETTKKMVVDILKTEDGKKAFEELMAEEKMQQKLVIESDVVKESINNVLVSEKATEMWKKLFKDPAFVKDFATSMKDEQQKLMKSLMNDADFQKQMLDLLQNPEIDDQMLSLMKGQQFRSHLEETIQQTLETPLFQEKIAELLLKAAEEKSKSEGGGGGEGEKGSEGGAGGGGEDGGG